MEFNTLEQRMAKSYLDMFPKFIPDKNVKICIDEQEKFYSLIKNLYDLAFNEPLLFVSSLHEDDVYPSRYKKSYGKPDLINNMRKFVKAMDLLLQNMYLLGQELDVKIDKRQKEILSRLNINNYNKLPKEWTWMAKRENSNIVEFKHCLFDRNYPYTSDIYANLLGEASFRKLENWMISQGYKKYDIYNLIASDCKLSLTYANLLWDKTAPRGGHEYKIKHTGISVQYDFYTQYPVILGLCIPNGLKHFLDNFQSMERKLKDFVVSQTKKCNGCRYCVQTDKTKSRPFVYITINHKKKDYNLCPYFPGYSYSWTKINDEIVEKIINMLKFMDEHIDKK